MQPEKKSYGNFAIEQKNAMEAIELLIKSNKICIENNEQNKLIYFFLEGRWGCTK